jgi:uncharacterized protein YecE (DUF72 family)
VDDVFVEKFQTFVRDCRRLLGSSSSSSSEQQHLGPLLLQFPPRFACTDKTLTRLQQFGQLIQRINQESSSAVAAAAAATTSHHHDHDETLPPPPPLRVALEFRNKSWFCQKVYNVAKTYNLCVCLVHLVNKNPLHWADDMPSGFSPKLDEYAFDACDWGAYVRFHGTTGQYEGSYTDKVLDDVLAKAMSNGKLLGELFVFFNNTDDGDPPSAIRDARHVISQAAAMR